MLTLTKQLGGSWVMAIPAGWYTDPSRFDRQRYWDGADWTENTAEIPIMQGQPQVSQPSWVAEQAAAAQPMWSAPVGAATVTLDAPATVFTAASVYVPEPERVTRPTLTREEREQVRRRTNYFGWVGLAIAVLSLFVNPWAIVGLAATAVSVIGLIRSMTLVGRGRGRAISVVGIMVGLGSTVYFAWSVVALVHQATGR